MNPADVPSSAPLVTPHFPLAVPALLAFSAGFVDAALFLAFGGLFVAQATGSFVVLGTELIHWTGAATIKVAAIPVFFVSALLTTFIIRVLGTATTRAVVGPLVIEAALLVAVVAIGSGPAEGQMVTMGELLGLTAMGVQGAYTSIYLKKYGSTNVMTTNTISFACEIADSIRGREIRPKLLSTGLVLMSFLVGTVIGGSAFTCWSYLGLILPIVLISGLALSATSLIVVGQAASAHDCQ